MSNYLEGLPREILRAVVLDVDLLGRAILGLTSRTGRFEPPYWITRDSVFFQFYSQST